MSKPLAGVSRAFSARSRRQRLDLFLRELSPTSESIILDIGVQADPRFENDNILEREWPWESCLIMLTIEAPALLKEHYPLAKVIRADGCRLPLADGSVDYVWSNAVLEHVGDIDRQKAFVLDCLRVARLGAFIATPNRWFPLETHINLPFVHWLPKPVRDAVFKVLGFPWMKTVYLLSETTFSGLFPVGSNICIVKQRIALVPHNLVAVFKRS